VLLIKHKWKVASLVLGISLVSFFSFYGRGLWFPVYLKMAGNRTIKEVINQYGPIVEPKVIARFKKAGIIYPPQKIGFYAIKQDKKLELWAMSGTNWGKVTTYPILKASGHLGPKLTEGDKQVPEGIYHISGLNPNSAYHLSMKLNYPNPFDLKQAQKEGRNNPGSNIFIHGKAVSVGCLAMGDEAIEELFILVQKMGLQEVEVIISPTDTRLAKLKAPPGAPVWTADLYQQITQASLKYSKGQFPGNWDIN